MTPWQAWEQLGMAIINEGKLAEYKPIVDWIKKLLTC